MARLIVEGVAVAGSVRVIGRVVGLAVLVAALITLALVVVGLEARAALVWGLGTVAGLAPFMVSAGVSSVMDTSIDALTGRPRGSQTDREPDADLTPLGVLLFVSVPLGAAALSIA